ncbi:precorrin-6A/cobalt-precorrin-6A reductase [Actinacidiphila rubida]|uniref:Precorrin-6A/cobalt-precorrin-6A reductase n=1 Tax=Actinacidiphila rubida TaxID=310780 RepID=A0A1H8NTE0_9ACTN|nr:cobalt-precorrin-6A reductase [Actinacidiphila rubida]SEO32864.1 precorrin-6A/cobalt-precorrin-6A reductase [Actinacidiphila rubida]
MRRVLILGGTGEARELARLLDGDTAFDVTLSLAGRTAAPLPAAGRTRSGGFGGAAGLAGWLRAERAGALVDATHPFAAAISRHAADAASAAAVPLLAVRRPGWNAGPGDRWHLADTLAEAAALLPALGTRAFLTVGRQDLAAFAATRLFCLVRSVDPPAPPLPADHRLVLARGPFTVEDELRLMRDHRIDVLVTKDSGGDATAAKLAAARAFGLPVLVVRRPRPPSGVPVARTPAEAAAWLRALPHALPPGATP